MFDGLDEVFDPAQRKEVITDIHRFTNDYPKIRVIVTSRVIGYKPQQLHNAGFRHYMLQDLESYQIDDFIRRWHDLNFKDEADKLRKRERFEKAIAESKAIRELAGNPLLLTMMAILNRNQELPRDRAELYNQASRVLLHHWDVERALIEDYRLDPKTIDDKDKQAMLRQVAYYMQTSGQDLAGNFINEQSLENILTDYLKFIEFSNARGVAKLLIHQLRARNFILCFLGDRSYAFVHRTFLEYFCAWKFVWQFKETQTLSIENLKIEVFGKYWQDETWHEVLRVIAGMIDARFVGEIINYLITQNGKYKNFVNLFLAADCLAEVRNQSSIPETRNRLFEAFYSLIKSNNADNKICTKGISTIATIWENEGRAWHTLKELAQSGISEYVSLASVTALAKVSKNHSEALSLLKNLAQSGNTLAIVELAKVWDKDPDILLLIHSLAKSGNQVALEQLVKTRSDDPSVLPLLKTFVSSVKDGVLRDSIIKALAKYWEHDRETLVVIKQLAKSGIPTAVVELAWTWENDPETLAILKSLARSGNPTAIVELVLGWGNHPRVITLIQDIIQSQNSSLSRSSKKQTRQDRLNFENNVNDYTENDIDILITALNRFGDDRTRELMESQLLNLSRGSHDVERIEVLHRIKQLRKEELKSRFSTLRTKVTNPSALISALRSVGISVKTDADVRGWNGQIVRAGIVAILEGEYDLGWSRNANGTFDLIVDLWGVARKYNQTELINSIFQRYAVVIKKYERFSN